MIHGLVFKRPIRLGEVIDFESCIVLVHVDREGRPLAHGLTVEASTAEEVKLQEQARSLTYQR